MKAKLKTPTVTKAFWATEHINLNFNPLMGDLVFLEDADASRPGRVKFKIRPTLYKGVRGYNTLRKAIIRIHGAPNAGGGGSEGQMDVGWYPAKGTEFNLEWTGKEIYVTWTSLVGLPTLTEAEPEKEAKPPYGADIEAATEYINETCPSTQGPLVNAEDATIVGPGRIRFKIRPGKAQGLRGYSTLCNRIAKVCGDPAANDGDNEGNESAGWERDNNRELWVEWEDKEISVLLVDRVVADAARPKRTKKVKVEESANLKLLRMLHDQVRQTMAVAEILVAKQLSASEQQKARQLTDALLETLMNG